MSVMWMSWSYCSKCYYRFDGSFEGVSDQHLQAHCHQFQEPSVSFCAHCCSHASAPADAVTTPTNRSCSSNSLNSTVWYPDSGATNHVTNYLENLKGAAAPYTGVTLISGHSTLISCSFIPSHAFSLVTVPITP
ncbi:uncharacterized protein [Gossypium hirsutum]|uniref:Uncharacterized protein n=1 Tax=Gossypium hirsutum TaxID=3635 RepID=A0ABM3ARP0_GOSHI|nr:uncharacterized protein LOC107892796 [Gossypium hirsutum]